jgi:hypothetical protein
MHKVRLAGCFSCFVSVEDVDWAGDHKWHVQNGYAHNLKLGRMHRQILARMTGQPVPKGMHTDHIDRDRLNNQRDNLRICTPAENLMNRPVQQNNTGRFKGVSRERRSGGWLARIGYQNRSIYIGHYSSEMEAAMAYDREALKLYGEFASLNF